MEINIIKYGIEIHCLVDDELDYEYILEKFKKYIVDTNDESKVNGCIYNLEVKNDEKIWDVFKNNKTYPYKMFHCCLAEYMIYKASYYIKCYDEFTNYVLSVGLLKNNIIIYKKNTEEYDNRRYIFNVICEIFSVVSYFNGYMKMHAGLFDYNGEGYIVLGEKKSGKTTLIMDLIFNGVKLVNNDITRVIYNRRENVLYGYEWIERVNIGKKTIEDNERLLNKLRSSGVLDGNNYNCQTDKYEFYKSDIAEFQYDLEKLVIKGIVIPHFDIRYSRTCITKRQENVTSNMLSMLKNTWLPIVSTNEIEVRDDVYLKCGFECLLDIYEIWYGSNKTKPAKELINIMSKGEYLK